MKKEIRFILRLLSLTIVIILVRIRCNRDKGVSEFVFNNCNLEASVKNDYARELFTNTLNNLILEFANEETIIIPTENFIPCSKCDAMTPAPCPGIIKRIANYAYYDDVTIRLFNCSKVYGAYTPARQHEISLSIILVNDIEELRRTIVHELAHMCYYNYEPTDHGDIKDSNYFKTKPLIAEYCFSGKATLADYIKSFKHLNSNQINNTCIISK